MKSLKLRPGQIAQDAAHSKVYMGDFDGNTVCISEFSLEKVKLMKSNMQHIAAKADAILKQLAVAENALIDHAEAKKKANQAPEAVTA